MGYPKMALNGPIWTYPPSPKAPFPLGNGPFWGPKAEKGPFGGPIHVILGPETPLGPRKYA